MGFRLQLVQASPIRVEHSRSLVVLYQQSPVKSNPEKVCEKVRCWNGASQHY